MRTIILSTLFFVTFSFISIAQDWLPLEVWNKAHFTLDGKYRVDYYSWWYSFSFFTFQISDSTTINGNKYYYSFSFFNFPDATPIRYDPDSCRIYLNKNGTEYLYMDFLLPDGNVLSQIQPNNTFLPVTIVSCSEIVLGDTVNLKGFIREATYPDRYKKGWYYFAPGMGVVKQIEQSDWLSVHLISFDLIEYRYFNDLGEIIHKKHSNSANIQFNPITKLILGQNLQQEFMVAHPFSARTYSFSQIGRTYLDSVYVESFYSNGLDTILNTDFSITATTEIDFLLNYPVSASLYQQGYSLYYRIVAKDKGIVPSYYYKPATGYYKLIYDPSPAQVTFSKDSIYIPTLADSGSVNIVNTSDHSVRIDSIISVGSFYGYWGEFSKPGFEYPFYLVQSIPGFMGDTLGIIIPPHDSINVSFSNVDLCPMCDYEVQEYFKDTLRFVFTFMDGNVYSFSKSIPISGEGHPSDVTDDKILPTKFVLEQNYPNPFNPSTVISYQLPVSGQVTLKVYDVLGKEVATLVNEEKAAGRYELDFQSTVGSLQLASGIYYYQLRAGNFIETKKMILLR
jgi:hypothetical protein